MIKLLFMTRIKMHKILISLTWKMPNIWVMVVICKISNKDGPLRWNCLDLERNCYSYPLYFFTRIKFCDWPSPLNLRGIQAHTQRSTLATFASKIFALNRFDDRHYFSHLSRNLIWLPRIKELSHIFSATWIEVDAWFFHIFTLFWRSKVDKKTFFWQIHFQFCPLLCARTWIFCRPFNVFARGFFFSSVINSVPTEHYFLGENSAFFYRLKANNFPNFCLPV